ncbi:MAG: threonylcarbamoyl-AMP synthase [Nitrospirales bacterium]|jgi:L-threonylcarbamoyladenylate synthase|nr:MAG: threonylcarbamoyl-AMP synthase [Nitrospirales bacterium]
MRLLELDKDNTKDILSIAVELLKNGGTIAYPTETFYGLGAKFDSDDALRKIYKIKQRPHDKAMPLIIGERDLLPVIAVGVSRTASDLMDTFWPGPLTLILPARENISEYITAGTHTIAVRIPGESFALRLAQAAHFPITATSANLSGLPPARDIETVLGYFGDRIDLIIDAGPTPGGLPSTIVDARGSALKILREGVIGRKSLEGL